MSTVHLSPRQNQVFEFILNSIVKNGYPPTVREIGDQFGINSPNGVTCHLKAIKKKGLIDWTPGRNRSIQIIGKSRRDIPLLTLDMLQDPDWRVR